MPCGLSGTWRKIGLSQAAGEPLSILWKPCCPWAAEHYSKRLLTCSCSPCNAVPTWPQFYSSPKITADGKEETLKWLAGLVAGGKVGAPELLGL